MLQNQQNIISEPEKAPADVLEEVDIYSMPENFRLSSYMGKAAKKTGLAIVIGGTLFFLCLGGAAYYYFFFKKPAPVVQEQQKKEEAPVVKEVKKEQAPVVSTIVEVKSETPKEAYLRLRGQASSTLLSIPSIDEIGEIIEEAGVSSSTAVLKIATKNSDREGTVTMVFEQAWKIASENWTDASSQGDNTSVTIDFKVSPDSDGDGLSDKEELLLGLNADNQDSDGDTYSDSGEMLNSYNPAGNGRLADNANIKKYINNAFSYEALYPAQWQASTAGGDESIVIRSADNQFFQIIAQPNPDKESIQSWYEKQFNERSNRSVSGANWEGVESEDGLIVYVTDRKHNIILTLTYNPGEGEYLDYLGLFRVLVKTLNFTN